MAESALGGASLVLPVRFESIDTVIAFREFGITGGIASGLMIGILVFTRSPAGYSRRVRWIVSGIAAMGFAPSIVRPIELPYVVFPSVFELFDIFGQTKLADVLIFGLVPWSTACAVIYEVWTHYAKPRPKGDS